MVSNITIVRFKSSLSGSEGNYQITDEDDIALIKKFTGMLNSQNKVAQIRLISFLCGTNRWTTMWSVQENYSLMIIWNHTGNGRRILTTLTKDGHYNNKYI